MKHKFLGSYESLSTVSSGSDPPCANNVDLVSSFPRWTKSLMAATTLGSVNFCEEKVSISSLYDTPSVSKKMSL